MLHVQTRKGQSWAVTYPGETAAAAHDWRTSAGSTVPFKWLDKEELLVCAENVAVKLRFLFVKLKAVQSQCDRVGGENVRLRGECAEEMWSLPGEHLQAGWGCTFGNTNRGARAQTLPRIVERPRTARWGRNGKATSRSSAWPAQTISHQTASPLFPHTHRQPFNPES
jgi:hypothetical protein